MLAGNHGQYLDGIYVRHYKTFYSSGYAVVKIIQISLVQHTTKEYLNRGTRCKR